MWGSESSDSAATEVNKHYGLRGHYIALCQAPPLLSVPPILPAAKLHPTDASLHAGLRISDVVIRFSITFPSKLHFLRASAVPLHSATCTPRHTLLRARPPHVLHSSLYSRI